MPNITFQLDGGQSSTLQLATLSFAQPSDKTKGYIRLCFNRRLTDESSKDEPLVKTFKATFAEQAQLNHRGHLEFPYSNKHLYFICMQIKALALESNEKNKQKFTEVFRILADYEDRKAKPKHYVEASHYKRDEASLIPQSGSHKTFIATNSKAEKVLVKTVPYPRKIVNYETANAHMMALLMGPQRVPKVRAVYKDGYRYGNAINYIDGLTSLPTYYQTLFPNMKNKDEREVIWRTKLSKAGLASLLLTSWWLEECDLHMGNYGFDAQNRLVRYDFDRSAFPFTCHFLGIDAQKGYSLPAREHQEAYFAIPTQQFPIDLRHIESLTNLPPSNDDIRKKPDKWFGEHPKERVFLPADRQQIADSALYRRDLYLHAIKLMVTPPEVMKAIATAHIPSKQPGKKAHAYAERYIQRAQAIKQALWQSPQFIQFLCTLSINDINWIKDEFEQYNNTFKADFPHCKVDVKTVQCATSTLILEACKQQRTITQQTFIDTLSTALQNAHYDKMGTGFFKKKLPDGIKALRELFQQNDSADLFNETRKILSKKAQTNKTSRDPMVNLLYKRFDFLAKHVTQEAAARPSPQPVICTA